LKAGHDEMEKAKLTVNGLASMIDHTLLKPYAAEDDFKKLCAEAAQYKFKMVAINSSAVTMCKELLKGSGVLVGAAISFPFGQTTIDTKVYETMESIKNGADEIDYVVNIVELKKKNYEYIEKEMKHVVDACRSSGRTVKVIFENCYLTDDEKKALCNIALKVRPDFIKTSTGFGTGGATVKDVRLMKSIVGDKVKVKAAGGIRTVEKALQMIEAGAERIGTSSGIKIIEGYKKYLNK
jgi:deoxyribose-phosphate aldolase